MNAPSANPKNPPDPHVRVEDLDLRYGDNLIQQDLSFAIDRGDIFIIMGGSGCGKSTLLKHLIGLYVPSRGRILYGDLDFWAADPEQRLELMTSMGVLYQQGALLSSLTLAENIAVPMEEHTVLSGADIRELAEVKLSLVGLAGYGDYYPSAISGGMRKRAALARAMALDPDILFFDEPSAGLDPLSARRLDDLILELRGALGATVVMVTHELDSIFAVGTNSVFLDAESKTIIASGDPRDLREHADSPLVRQFLTRGEERRP